MVHWIYEKRNKMFHVSRKMMCDLWKAKRTFEKKKKKRSCHLRFICHSELVWKIKVNISALSQKKNHNWSKRPILHDWLNRFLCNTHASNSKVIYFSWFWYHCHWWNSGLEQHGSYTTVEVAWSKEVPFKLTGHNKISVSICLTGKAVETKCKPFIALKGPKRESKFSHEEFKWKWSVATFTNEWWMRDYLCIGAMKFWEYFPFAKD